MISLLPLLVQSFMRSGVLRCSYCACFYCFLGSNCAGPPLWFGASHRILTVQNNFEVANAATMDAIQVCMSFSLQRRRLEEFYRYQTSSSHSLPQADWDLLSNLLTNDVQLVGSRTVSDAHLLDLLTYSLLLVAIDPIAPLLTLPSLAAHGSANSSNSTTPPRARPRRQRSTRSFSAALNSLKWQSRKAITLRSASFSIKTRSYSRTSESFKVGEH